MPRTARYRGEDMLSAAARLAADGGPEAVTIGGISAATGAPVGSIYHRFESRGLLVAELWLSTMEAFQAEYLEVLGPRPTAESGLRAALHIPAWVRVRPAEARILILHRREDFVGPEWPAPVAGRARDLNVGVAARLAAFARAVLGSDGEEALARAWYALGAAPLAAVRRYLAERQRPPDLVDDLVRETYEAVIVRTAQRRGPDGRATGKLEAQ
jgi:AcrR family transcriptional regulator